MDHLTWKSTRPLLIGLCLLFQLCTSDVSIGDAGQPSPTSTICNTISKTPGVDPVNTESAAECVPPTTAADGATTTAGVGSVGYEYCELFPVSGQGPFYIPKQAIRSNITEGKPGVPVTLTFIVRDVETCAPLANVPVDLWHSDALGYYSGYRSFYKDGQLARTGGRHVDPTDSDLFLRGLQYTDADGRVTFKTIFPGWYAGRTNHYHIEVRTADGVQYPGHIYFTEEATAAVAHEEPYKHNKNPKVPNSDDWSYMNRGGEQTTIKFKGDVKSGLKGTMVLGIRN